MKHIVAGIALGFVAGGAFTIYFSPRVPALLWWLFGNGE